DREDLRGGRPTDEDRDGDHEQEGEDGGPMHLPHGDDAAGDQDVEGGHERHHHGDRLGNVEQNAREEKDDDKHGGEDPEGNAEGQRRAFADVFGHQGLLDSVRLSSRSTACHSSTSGRSGRSSLLDQRKNSTAMMLHSVTPIPSFMISPEIRVSSSAEMPKARGTVV